MLSSQVSDMNEDLIRQRNAHWIIEDVVERDAIQNEDWDTKIYMVGIRSEDEARRITRLAVKHLEGSDHPDQPTLEELSSAAREWVANSSRPVSSDNNNVPF